MTTQRLHAGLAPIDVLTRIELEESLSKGFEQAERARVRGIDYMEVNTNGNNAATLALNGPESGYAWSLKLISAVLSAAATLSVYLGEAPQATAPIGVVTLSGAGAAIVTYTSNIIIVRDARQITLVSSAGGIGAVKLIARQVPDEMIGKL